MVAFAGANPIGVLIGAKRPHATLVHRIAVHPDHRRQGHGRHLLDSLGSKLAILGPPRIVSEVPEAFVEAGRLFSASGYVEETVLTDYVLDSAPIDVADVPGRYVIPVTVDDLAANGLVGEADQQVCWERSLGTLNARKDVISGLALASGEQIEAYLLYIGAEVTALRTLVEDDGARLRQLLSRVRVQGITSLRLPKVHPAEISAELLQALGFRAVAAHRLYAATPRSA
jgi:L-amino acid N-acyltransferase YncA